MSDDQRRAAYASVFGELRSALKAAERLGRNATAEDRDRLRAAVAAARELVRTEQLRTRGEWRARGHLQSGALYLEERDHHSIDAAEELLRRR